MYRQEYPWLILPQATVPLPEVILVFLLGLDRLLGQSLRELKTIPNVGPAVAADLILLGVTSKADLIDRDPLEMYQDLSKLTGQRQDPCVLDVFMAVVDFANGAAARPWWKYTPKRKAMLKRRSE